MKREKHLLNEAYDAEEFRKLAHRVVDMLADYLSAARRGETGKVLPGASPGELVEKYRELLDGDADLESMLKELFADSNHLHHPGYMGHQVCPPVPVTAISSMVGSLLNNGSAVYEMGMANVAMERIVIKKLARQMGYPGDADGVLTSGGSLGNLTAMLAARQEKSGYDAWEEGVQSGQRPVFLVSEYRHYSIDRNIRIMGIGAEGCVLVPCDARFKVIPERIPGIVGKLKAEGRQVIGMIANAGATLTGTFDPLEQIAEVCREHDIWLHVDGAHGGPAVFSDTYAHFTTGIGQADSVVIDFHKMAMTPGLNTAVIFRKGTHSYGTFAQKASYLFSREGETEWYQFARRTMECTKSMMGLNVFALLKRHGTELIGENVTRLFDLARDFYRLLEQDPQFETVHYPESNILVFRYYDANLNLEQCNHLNADAREAVLQQGHFYIVRAEIDGRIYLRVSVMNPFSTVEGFRQLLKEIKDHAKQHTI